METNAEHELSGILKHLPSNPGVYRYYDAAGRILYVGKAKNLKKRVTSYFTKNDHPARTQLLVKRIAQIEYSVVGTEKDALLLENALIKDLQPKFNVMLKDDKTFPYIRIVHEPYPRIFFTRNIVHDGSEYFGPYTSIHHVRSLLDTIKRMYPIRSCSLALTPENIRKKKFRVCLEYHIGNCLGPCAGHQTKAEYDHNIREIRSILKGKLSTVRQVLKEQMEAFAADLEFEKAEVIRVRLQSLKEYISVSTVSNPNLGNFHVFGFVETEKQAFVNYLYVYEGTVVRTKAITLQKNLDETPEELLQYAMIDATGGHFPEAGEEVLLPFPVDAPGAAWSIVVPKIGDKKKLVELAQKNALFQQHKGKSKQKTDRHERLMELMQNELRLKEPPLHIECFDNSNFQGTNAVSACVVFKNGKPSKKDYRHFNVQSVQGPNDFDTMKEVVLRRYKRLLDEGQPLPQLIVIDGGKGQLGAAIESLEVLGIANKVQVISIAKRLEELYYPNDPLPLMLSRKSETLRVIQQLRDEAHRFGITFHRNKRDKQTLKTELTDIEGIGPALAQKLLQAYGSVKALEKAGSGELERIVGPARAEKIAKYFASKHS